MVKINTLSRVQNSRFDFNKLFYSAANHQQVALYGCIQSTAQNNFCSPKSDYILFYISAMLFTHHPSKSHAFIKAKMI